MDSRQTDSLLFAQIYTKLLVSVTLFAAKVKVTVRSSNIQSYIFQDKQ